jgi:hypothetical protein
MLQSGDALSPEELSPQDGSPIAGMSSQMLPLGAGSHPGLLPSPASGLHPAALPPPSPASQPGSGSPIDKLKMLPPVQRFLALPDKQRTLIVGIAGGAVALLMIVLAIVIALPSTVRIEVRSTPPAVEVIREGKVVGTTPLTLKLAPGEKARLVLRKDGFEEVERVVSASNQTAINVELTAEPPTKPTVVTPPNTDTTKSVDTVKSDPSKTDPSKQPVKSTPKGTKKGPKKKPAIF